MKLPDKYRGHGLRVFCMKNGCKKDIGKHRARCGLRDVLTKYCEHQEHHRYQSRIWDGETKTFKIKTWPTTDFKETYRAHLVFKDQCKHLPPKSPTRKLPTLLTECIGFYGDWLEDINVPDHEKKGLTEKHINQVSSFLLSFNKVLKVNKINTRALPVINIDSHIVGIFHNYLKKKGYSSWTYNAYIKTLRAFFNFLIEKGVETGNPFKDFKRRPTATDPIIVEEEEFTRLLSMITPENGRGQRGTKKQTENHYRPWLKDALLAHVLIGARPNEMLKLTWEHVHNNYLAIPNWKVNKLEKTDTNIDYVPLTRNLSDLLMQLGKGEGYLIAPGIENRKQLQAIISRAFTHFWRLTGINKDVKLMHLRKTYITRMSMLYGEKGLTIHHKNKETAIEHYQSKRSFAEKLEGVEMFNF